MLKSWPLYFLPLPGLIADLLLIVSSLFWSRSCRVVQGVSGCVWRELSCLQTSLQLCFTNASPHPLEAAAPRSSMPSPQRMWNWLKRNLKLNTYPAPPPFPSNDMQTQIHARTHAHLHWCRASLSACSTLLSPFFAFFPAHDLWPTILSMQSLWPPTSTFPFTPWDCVLLGLLCFRWFPCAVSLASMPLSVVLSVWRQSFTGQVWLGIWALDRLMLHPTVPSAQGGVFYQVATPLPLSSWAFPVGRTRSWTGSVLNGQPYFFSFWFLFCFSCVRTQ